MAKIINCFLNGDEDIVTQVGNDWFAKEVYKALKEKNEQTAIAFMEKYRYFKFTGRTM